MASQIFKFPLTNITEYDLTPVSQEPYGVPAGVIGSSEMGPAFVPHTIGSFNDFRSFFGDPKPHLVAPYAVEKFLENKNALTFIRLLGAGNNQVLADIEKTQREGSVKNAGFFISASIDTDSGWNVGGVHFLTARHEVTPEESYGFPIFSNNDTYFTTGAPDEAFLVRGTIFAASSARIFVMSYNDTFDPALTTDVATVDPTDRTFKIVVSSSLGLPFGSDDGLAGVRIFTASLDPTSDHYFAKILNTDPNRFVEDQHYVYSDYSVDEGIARVGTSAGDVVLSSGSLNTTPDGGDVTSPFLHLFGRFDTRYTTPTTPWFISQPFGKTEYDLFRFETISDGAFTNNKFKISIASLQKSSNPNNPFGTFSVIVRDFNDTDTNPIVIEQFNDVTLDPNSDNYIAKVIGDKKSFFNFDVEDPSDRRVVTRGRHANRSRFIRVIMNSEVERGNIPKTCLPFGFRGVEALKTNSDLTDTVPAPGSERLAFDGTPSDPRIAGAVVPPIPFTFKVTRGLVSSTASYVGEAGATEIADNRYFWGVKTGIISDPRNPNVSTKINPFIKSITKFNGISKLDVLVTGSKTDVFNNNKFTLANVALNASNLTELTSSVSLIMRDAAYIRNGEPDGSFYKVVDPISNNERVTFATLLQNGTVSEFNRFTEYAKFTTVFYGGFDGVNILDKNARTFNDRSTSVESRGNAYGCANVNYISPGFLKNQTGVSLDNSTVNSYRIATDIITDAIISNINILAIPGQREPLVVDYALSKMETYGLGIYVIDVPYYNPNGERIFDGDTGQYVDLDFTSDMIESRALNTSYGAAYFPNYTQYDAINKVRVTLPASVAALAALAYNDRVAYPWFAPAGFNRASLDFVERTQVKVRNNERERMYSVKINPIVKFPRDGHVIMAQNTLMLDKSDLNSINVQRMISSVKRTLIQIGNQIIFDQNVPELRSEFVKNVSSELTTLQTKLGIEKFRIICDETNNSAEDVENLRMNAQIRVVPTRAIEFIDLDLIVTNAGVAFV